MILKIKLIKPGYPFLEEKWISVNVESYELDMHCDNGFSVSDVKVIK
jgi:hypothetical protein